MPLPDQDMKDSYSYEEMQHVVAREVMKHRMEDFEKKLSEHEVATAAVLTEIRTTLQEIKGTVNRGTSEIRECRIDLKREIDKEFLTRLEAARLEGELRGVMQALEGKVDKMWAKSTVAVSVATSIIMVVLKLLGWL